MARQYKAPGFTRGFIIKRCGRGQAEKFPMPGVPVCRTEPEESIPKTIKHGTPGHCIKIVFWGQGGRMKTKISLGHVRRAAGKNGGLPIVFSIDFLMALIYNFPLGL